MNMSFTIALAGNPNCGKTTLFNLLTGASQRVGNWPGVTIDKKVGKIKGTDSELVDLPGIYSMSPYSPEEIVSRNFIVDEKPDAVINIVDATNLERNLFLSLQLIDMGIPMVIALNMMDQVRQLGDKIDVAKLSEGLGVEIVPISAAKRENIDELVAKVMSVAESKKAPRAMKYSDDVMRAEAAAEVALSGKVPEDNIRFYAYKLIEDDSAVNEMVPGVRDSLNLAIKDLESQYDDSADSIIADSRYSKITEIVSGAYTKAPRDERGTLSDRIDKIVTHRILGLPIFIAIIALVYFIAMYDGDWGQSPGAAATAWVNDVLFGEIIEPGAADWCDSMGVSEPLKGLLVDGIIHGVGAVLGFLPQMIILFICLVILEEVGYMARVAFVMDRIFRYFNLSGKSFIPLLVGTGCGVPGVMSCRTIESEADRRITAMTVTFMPCGAKLPVIAAITAALAGAWWVGVLAYFGGIVLVIVSGIILKKFKHLAGKPAPFIMELPPYRLPGLYSSLKTVFDRSWAFVKKAGTIILLTVIVIWFLSHYTFSFHFIDPEEDMGDSILAGIGGVFAYLFMPLGWGDSWELASASITGLIAKEDLIGTLAVVLGSGEEAQEVGEILALILPKSAIMSFFVFNMYCAPCFAAIGAIHRELGNWKHTGIAVAYQCLLAYAIASIVYVVYGTCIGDNIEVYSYVVAVIAAIVLVYVLVAKDPFRQFNKPQEVAA